MNSDDILAVDSAAPAEVGELDLYQKREKNLHPRD